MLCIGGAIFFQKRARNADWARQRTAFERGLFVGSVQDLLAHPILASKTQPQCDHLVRDGLETCRLGLFAFQLYRSLQAQDDDALYDALKTGRIRELFEFLINTGPSDQAELAPLDRLASRSLNERPMSQGERRLFSGTLKLLLARTPGVLLSQRAQLDQVQRAQEKKSIDAAASKHLEKRRALEQRLVKRVASLLRARYKWGGKSVKSGIDCSALVQLLFKEVLGICLPRTVRDIRRVGVSVKDQVRLPDGLQTFDLLIYQLGRGPHIGLYIEDWGVVHASSSRKRVVVDRLRGDLLRPIDVRRFPQRGVIVDETCSY